MAKRKSSKNIDVPSIDNMSFNEKTGAQKNMEVGRLHLPLDKGDSTKTTDASTACALPYKGACLAVYNNSGTVGAITIGEDNTVAALAPGAVDAIGLGHVGVPCGPNAWTFIACFDKQWVRSTSSALLVFLIADDTTVS